MSGSGISWARCKSAPCFRQITTPAPHSSVFTGRMPFLPPNQQRQSTEGIKHWRNQALKESSTEGISPKQSKHWKSATFQNRSIFCYKHQIVRNCNMTIFLLRPKSSTTQLYFQQWENFTVNTCLFSFSSTIEILQRLRRHCYLQSTNGNTEASDEITW